MKYAIAIDGPSGSGKSTLAKEIAKRLGLLYLDTGALYRTVGLSVLQKFGSEFSSEQVVSLLEFIKVDLTYRCGVQHVKLNGVDVSSFIRTQQVADAASRVSSLPEVRAFLLDAQRNITKKHSVIMDGRDVGTVVLPDAKVKIFLTASAEVRAKRRCDELVASGQVSEYQQVLKEVLERDARDMNRAIAPLRKAEDAVLLDNSELSFEQTVSAALNIIDSKFEL